MSFEMTDFVNKIKMKPFPMKIKIGIHYGRVIAGVIGYHKPQFSLIGDTVNTASRVCSTTAEGKIAISEGVYQTIKDSGFRFTPREVYVKQPSLWD
jgi:class 3 adenylate cyclase